MHMADALISPFVGGTMMLASASIASISVKKLQIEQDDRKIPLMGVMGAFIFAAQMINFSIPATGSSGHIGGGMLLAILLGPYAGFLTMASVLLIQALLFGDGGLLAYGCNVFNLGFFTCYIAYPLIYTFMTRQGLTARRIFNASLVSSIVALQLGSFSVVLQTLLSGKTELPFGAFALLMQPIHLAIGIVEGMVTASVVTFVWKARPEIVEYATSGKPLGRLPLKNILFAFLVIILLVGGVLSWFASTKPDGLEWSVERTTGTTVLELPNGIHQVLAIIQNQTALLPDYGFKVTLDSLAPASEQISYAQAPSDRTGTSVSALIGGALTLILVASTGLVIGLLKKKSARSGLNNRNLEPAEQSKNVR